MKYTILPISDTKRIFVKYHLLQTWSHGELCGWKCNKPEVTYEIVMTEIKHWFAFFTSKLIMRKSTSKKSKALYSNFYVVSVFKHVSIINNTKHLYIRKNSFEVYLQNTTNLFQYFENQCQRKESQTWISAVGYTKYQFWAVGWLFNLSEPQFPSR